MNDVILSEEQGKFAWLETKVVNPKKWTAETPNLVYSATTLNNANNEVIEQITHQNRIQKSGDKERTISC